MNSIKFLADKGMDFNRIFKYGIVNIFWEELCVNKLKIRTIILKMLDIFIRVKLANKKQNLGSNSIIQFWQKSRKNWDILWKLFHAEFFDAVNK